MENPCMMNILFLAQVFTITNIAITYWDWVFLLFESLVCGLKPERNVEN